MRTWNFPGRRQQRHEGALARQAAYDALTTEQKLERARGRRGSSRREVARLMRPEGARS